MTSPTHVVLHSRYRSNLVSGSKSWAATAQRHHARVRRVAILRAVENGAVSSQQTGKLLNQNALPTAPLLSGGRFSR